MSHWFEYFPGHFMWSQGIIFAVEMAPWGAAALGEIDQVGQRLRGREGDNDAWWAEWSAMADRLAHSNRASERTLRAVGVITKPAHVVDATP